ncbi:MAG: rod shape-determining protein [Ruminococcaceae bacterium]|nr:rod shape-determining protein [Oscillospiraceae bacterium]
MKFGSFSNNIAIDMGTDNTRVYYKGIITNEPSVIAIDSYDGHLIAIGTEAYNMIEKNPEAITVVKPLSKGVIANFELACQMLQGFLSKITGSMIKPRAMVSIPCGITDVEKRAMCDVVRASGIREVFVIEAPIAGAIGANCDVSLARGMMLVDIGSGSCDIAAISLNQTVLGRSVKVGGNDFTEALIKYVEEKHGLLIGTHTAERIKKEIGCAFQRDDDEMCEVSGYNIKSEKPDKIIVRSEETREAFSDLISRIVTEIKAMLDETPTELLGDIMEDGILLIGGGAQLYGLAKRLRIELNVKVFLAEDADMCVLRGASSVCENMDKMPENTYVFTKG